MVYVHVPFCISFCTYCDFYSELCGRGASRQVQSALFDSYVARVRSEIAARREEIAAAMSPDTIYFGGGTPSVLPLEAVRGVVEALAQAGATGRDEFTFEVNPDDILRGGEAYVRGLVELGVNRVSMGVQSFDDGILRWMNRRHSASQAAEAFGILRSCGVDNISIDLIFGLSQLTDSQWLETVEKAIALAPEHISAYQLSIEEGSALGQMVRDGRYVEAPDEQCRRQYDLLCAALASAGFGHYEISNWARPGRRAVHNSAYWSRRPYVGLGPGAHSLRVGESQVRSWNTQALEDYSSQCEVLTAEDIATERVMLGLRTSEGVAREDLGASAIPLLEQGSLVLLESGRVRIPEDHFFVSDDIISLL